jgi:hypothetical protein
MKNFFYLKIPDKYKNGKFYGLVAFAVSFLLFGWVLVYGYFFSDDFTLIWHGNRIVSGEIGILTAHISTFYSPVINTWYTVMVGLFKFNPLPYFLFGIIVHVGVAWLLGLLVRELTKSWFAGLVALLFFVVTGAAHEPILWISANMHNLAALWMVLSVYLLVVSFGESSQKRVGYFLAGSFLSCLLALGTKEIAALLPILILAVAIKKEYFVQILKFRFSYLSYFVATLAVWGFYIFKQFQWQSTGVWVKESVFQISLIRLARGPLAILDVVFPLRFFINENVAPLLLFATTAILLLILYVFRKQRVVWLGLLWATCTALPVVFYRVSVWWEPLASRYSYHIRIGLAIMFSLVIADLILKSRRKYTSFFMVSLFSIWLVFQSLYNVYTARKDYPYVYRTGESLHSAAEQISEQKNLSRVLVLPGRPFEENYAHIVGLFETISAVREEDIFFLDTDIDITRNEYDIELFWDYQNNSYSFR